MSSAHENEDLKVLNLNDPRAIRLADGSLYLKISANEFLRCPPELVAALQQQTQALGMFAHARLEANTSLAQSFIQKLVSNAPEPASDLGAVACVPCRSDGSLVLGFQFEDLMPWAVRLDAERARDLAAAINRAYPQLFN